MSTVGAESERFYGLFLEGTERRFTADLHRPLLETAPTELENEWRGVLKVGHFSINLELRRGDDKGEYENRGWMTLEPKNLFAVTTPTDVGDEVAMAYYTEDYEHREPVLKLTMAPSLHNEGRELYKIPDDRDVGVHVSKYGKLAQDKIEKNLHEYKHRGKFKNREQSIAVGINQAREAGGKVPSQKRKSNA